MIDDEDKGVWRTVSGRRIFIREGQSLTEAMRESGKFRNTPSTTKKTSRKYEDWSSEDKKKFRRWYRKHAEELAKANPGKSEPEIRKLAQEEWGEKNLDVSKTETSETKSKSEDSKKETSESIDYDNLWDTNDPYVYHIDATNADIDSFRREGIRPSDKGYQGEGVYMATTPEDTLYNVDKVEDGTLYRIKKKDLVQKFGLYSKDNPDGIQYDDGTHEVMLGGKRNVPPEMLEVKRNGVWEKLVETKSVSDRIKEQRAKQDIEKNYKEHTFEELKAGKFDKEQSKLVLEDGSEVALLPQREYKKICEQQLTNSSNETKEIVDSYTMTQQTAGSADLNSISDDNLENHRFIRRVNVCYDKSLISTSRERDQYLYDSYQDWVKNFEPREKTEDRYKLRTEWQKKWGYDYSQVAYPLADIAKEKLWTDDEIAEAKAIYPTLKALDDEYIAKASDLNWEGEEFLELRKEHLAEYAEVVNACENERLKQKNRSPYWYNTIANYDSNKVYNATYDTDTEEEKGTIKRLNTQELLDLDYTPELKSLQTDEVNSTIEGLKKSVSQFDTAFEKDGIALDRDILVYRRGRETRDEVENGFTKLGYVSCSAKDTLPKKMPSGLAFGEMEYYIVIPKGTKVLFAEDIIGYKTNPNDTSRIAANRGLKRQHEVILPRGTHFTKVDSLSWSTHILKAEVKKNGK